MKHLVLLFALSFLLLGVVTVLGDIWQNDKSLALAQSEVKLGEKIYRENCAACHGEKGDGNGPEAQRLKTKPRDFTNGIYQFRSTPSGSLPLDQDIFRTITRGIRGTSMLAQLQLSESERSAVVQYVKTFSKRFKEETVGQAIPIPRAPSPNAKLIALGKSNYQEAGCAECHGLDGRGDGPSAKDLKDDWGNPISPADLSLKPFKSGPEPEDLYRTISTGLNGTPMPSYADALAPRERWALVSYILSIATREKPTEMMGLVGEEVEGMRIDMRAAMAGMMGGRGMMGRGGGMMDRNMNEMMKNRMGR
jgi:mono/diheme cytochrome c family protein